MILICLTLAFSVARVRVRARRRLTDRDHDRNRSILKQNPQTCGDLARWEEKSHRALLRQKMGPVLEREGPVKAGVHL